MSLDPNATEVTVVANVDGTDCRFELALSELGVDEFEARVNFCPSLAPLCFSLNDG